MGNGGFICNRKKNNTELKSSALIIVLSADCAISLIEHFYFYKESEIYKLELKSHSLN